MLSPRFGRMDIAMNGALLGALVVGATVVFAGCGSDAASDRANRQAEATTNDSAGNAGTDTSHAAPKPSRKRRERTTSVRTSRAFRGNLVVPVVAEGTVRARHNTELHVEIPGRIVHLAVREGQSLRKGALVAKLDDREYAVATEEAKSKYFQALSLLAIEDESIEASRLPDELQNKIDELARLEREGVITREERLAREIALDVQALKDGYYRLDVLAARSGIAAARAGLERARLNLERTEIRAPFSGVVTGLDVSEGEQITLGQALCTIVNTTNIEADVGVLESDIGKLAVGRKALLAIPALGDTLGATVDVISPQFDRDSRTCNVMLRIHDTSGNVRPGMFVRAIIAGETFTDRLLVPKEAILTRDGRPLLFKVEDNRARWLYLKIGRQNDNLVEVERVLQGGSLEPGDPVVVSDHLTLAHEAKVKVKKNIPSRDPWNHTN